MNYLNNYDVVLWDFDGVIIDSMKIRTMGFRILFQNYSDSSIQKLIDYHLLNGGKSRFVKIEFFYENVLKKSITKSEVQLLAKEYSSIVFPLLCEEKLLISKIISYIKENRFNQEFHIVSGSEHFELNDICKELNIDQYFKTIHGSPTKKEILVSNILKRKESAVKTCLVGDSINDFNAAKKNNIDFVGFNNERLKKITKLYLD